MRTYPKKDRTLQSRTGSPGSRLYVESLSIVGDIPTAATLGYGLIAFRLIGERELTAYINLNGAITRVRLGYIETD